MNSTLEAFLEALPYLLKVIPGLGQLIEALINDKGGSVEQAVREALNGGELKDLHSAVEKAANAKP